LAHRPRSAAAHVILPALSSTFGPNPWPSPRPVLRTSAFFWPVIPAPVTLRLSPHARPRARGVQSKQAQPMHVGYVSDEYYAALADVAFEFRDPRGKAVCVRSSASGAVLADLPPGSYEVCLSHSGFGSKRVRVDVGKSPLQFRLLSDRLLGYAWPKWCR